MSIYRFGAGQAVVAFATVVALAAAVGFFLLLFGVI